ncbi:MAG: hypothetical protein B6245_11315 [Desulfobacteraceae bacterium 4572_88]|nr:MAG: hypothetical protein B6245_11315 [Desulfobacteraceae bacterium 4572_88]RLC08073.1 MAG: DUF3782 domain-containing protein [Deltaproteobacteria bacterium]
METTIQEVWTLFRETDRRFQATDKLLSQKFQETDRKFQETDRKFQETDRKFQETEKLLALKSQETNNEIQRVSANVDKLTGKWGRFVEGLVEPGVLRLFRDRGIEIGKIFQRVKGHKKGDTMEIDILGVNHEYVVLVEVKSTLGSDDVKDHLRRLGRFKNFFPEYADRKVLGAVAGIVIEENVGRFAYRQGLFVIAQSGDAVKILNDESFRPKTW